MHPPRFSIATARFDEISPSARKLHDVICWLEGRQKEDGSWGADSLLDRLTCTCHAALLLLACGYSPEDQRLTEAFKYLTVGGGASSDWFFWGFAPLMNIAKYETTVERDLQVLADRYRDGAAPHPDQLLEVSALKAYLWSEQRYLADHIDDYLKSLISSWSQKTAWKGRADSTAHALSVLDQFDFPNKEHIVQSSIDFLVKSARRKGDHIRWGESQISTAYVVISIAESWLWEDERLRNLAEAASHGLLLDCRDRHWLTERPPYGGDAEIRSPEYTTAAISRAILAVLTRNDETILLQLNALRCHTLHESLQLAHEVQATQAVQLKQVESKAKEYEEKIRTLEQQGVLPKTITLPWLIKHLPLVTYPKLLGLITLLLSLGFAIHKWIDPIFSGPSQESGSTQVGAKAHSQGPSSAKPPVPTAK